MGVKVAVVRFGKLPEVRFSIGIDDRQFFRQFFCKSVSPVLWRIWLADKIGNQYSSEQE